MFRRLLLRLQGKFCRMLKTILTLFDCRSEVLLHMCLQLYLELFKNHIWFNAKLKIVKKKSLCKT